MMEPGRDAHEPSTEAQVTSWDRSLAVADRWLPHVLLAASTVLSVIQPQWSWGERAGTLILAAAAGTWVALGHTFAPEDRRRRPSYALTYVAGVLAFAAALMARDVAFFLFAISGFLHAAVLRPVPLVFVGTGTTSFLILLFTWDGLPSDVGAWITFAAVLLVQTFLIGFGVVGGDKLAELSEERRRSVARLEATLAENEDLHAQLVAQAREAGIHDERQRMAREIHDTLAQGLTGVITQLEAADQHREEAVTRQHHLDTASALARASLVEARRSVRALGPGALERGRLADALDELVRDWTLQTGVRADATVTGSAAPLPTEVEVVLLRVAQEALTNVAKHADATRVGVTLSRLDEDVVLDVRDDGRGFDPAAVTGGVSFGLDAMRQRVTAVGGTFTLEAQPSAGTAISAAVPVPTVVEAAGG